VITTTDDLSVVATTDATEHLRRRTAQDGLVGGPSGDALDGQLGDGTTTAAT
jgi:hypothetical protein